MSGAPAAREDDRRLGLPDLVFVAAHGPAAGAALLLVLLAALSADGLVELVQRSMPFAPDDEGRAFAVAAGTVLLGGLFAAGAWRAARGPVPDLTSGRAATTALAALLSSWFWLLVVAGIIRGR